MQVCPLAFLHAPLASQICVELQVSSTAAFTALQVPGLPKTLQAMHDPAQALLQRFPSAQAPLVHSAAAAQVCPLAFFATHLPALQ